MDTSIILDTANSVINFPAALWATLSASFGTVPAIIVIGLSTVGIYYLGKKALSWFANKLSNLFNKREVSLPPQTPVVVTA